MPRIVRGYGIRSFRGFLLMFFNVFFTGYVRSQRDSMGHIQSASRGYWLWRGILSFLLLLSLSMNMQVMLFRTRLPVLIYDDIGYQHVIYWILSVWILKLLE